MIRLIIFVSSLLLCVIIKGNEKSFLQVEQIESFEEKGNSYTSDQKTIVVSSFKLTQLINEVNEVQIRNEKKSRRIKSKVLTPISIAKDDSKWNKVNKRVKDYLPDDNPFTDDENEENYPLEKPHTYNNIDQIEVQSPTHYKQEPPQATAQCNDGSYSFSLNRRGTCSGHGGVAIWLK